ARDQSSWTPMGAALSFAGSVPKQHAPASFDSLAVATMRLSGPAATVMTGTDQGTDGSAPAVSIVVATYNWSSALRCALRSIQLQSVRDFEVLVVGDGCTDDSETVVRSFEDPRFRWANLPRNHGGQYAPNNHGLDLARADWVAYLGHDDIWHPRHL